MNPKKVFLSLDCSLLHRINNDWNSDITLLFLRPNDYFLYHTQIVLGRVMLYMESSFGRQDRRENVTVEWRKGIMEMEESVVGLKDDGKHRTKN